MSAIRVEVRANGVAVVTLDDPDRPVNTLSQALVDDFNATILPVLDDSGVRAVVVASAKKDFIAGADLKGLLATDAAHEAARFSREGNALLSRIAASPKPVVAAIHGAALGGGLEVALACHYLLASSDTSTVLALPEVMLGLLPAGGGTQRLPRRIGLLAALPLLLTGTRVRVRRARRMGLVDAVTTPGGIVDTAVRAAEMLADGRLSRPGGSRSLADRVAAGTPARALVLRRARKEVMARTRGLYPAPLAVLECVETGLSRGIEAGLACESQHFGELVASRHGKNLIRLFLGMQELKKTPEDARPVHRVGVVGAGLMGSGIASVSVGRWPVVLRDISDEALTPACRSVRSGLAKQVRSGAITGVERDRRWARLLPTTRLDDLAGCDLVVEAVFEDLELKRRVIAEVEDLVGPEAVIASNTSALPIAAVAARARHPERILGMHYFSPVPKMPLLEIVAAAATAPSATATARAVGVAQGKSVIVVSDGPGFYTTRILAPYLNEAVTLIEEGAAIDAVDGALKDAGFPVGPVALIDEVGIDVGAHVASDLGAAFAARGVSSSDALPRLAEAGFAGRKNRRGFYLYPDRRSGGRKKPNPEIYERLGGGDRRPFDAGAMAARCLLLMVNEAVHALQDGVIASPRDGDIGAILGLGFPPFRGGPFRYLDAEGPAAVCDRLDRLAEELGARFEPAPLLRETARSGGTFHPS